MHLWILQASPRAWPNRRRTKPQTNTMKPSKQPSSKPTPKPQQPSPQAFEILAKMAAAKRERLQNKTA